MKSAAGLIGNEERRAPTIVVEKALGYELPEWFPAASTEKTRTTEKAITEKTITDATVAVLPNPAFDHAAIHITVPKGEYATVTVSDMLGRSIPSLSGVEYAGGEHTIDIRASSLASGVYRCTVQTATQRAYTQFIITK